jgi:hypothetical protein
VGEQRREKEEELEPGARIPRKFRHLYVQHETPEQRDLGWSPQRTSEETTRRGDYKAEDYLTAEVTSGKAFWTNPIQLDQGTEGACAAAIES